MFIQYVKNHFGPQRGAMFSMDARIALVIASVLAGVVGTQILQKIERNRVERTEQGATTLIEGLKTYYQTVALDSVPPGDPSTFNSGTGNFKSVILDTGIVSDADLATDAWGRTWTYDTCSVDHTIEGVAVTVQYVVLYSGGPDQTDDSGSGDFLANATCEANFAAWQPVNDDIGVKFNTFDIERDRVAEMKRKLDTIKAALQSYETQQYLENQSFCATPANQTSTPRCDFDGASGYLPGEEVNLNYFPRSVNDTQDTSSSPYNYYYIPYGRSATGDEISEVTNSQADMEGLMALIGLTADYAKDPWGRLLCYNSNKLNSTQAPFTATVIYSNSCP